MKVRRGDPFGTGAATYRRGIGAPYSISENGFGGGGGGGDPRLGDPLTHPLLFNGQMAKSIGSGTDGWAKPAQIPVAVQRAYAAPPLMGGGVRTPSSAGRPGAVGEPEEPSPDTSESVSGRGKEEKGRERGRREEGNSEKGQPRPERPMFWEGVSSVSPFIYFKVNI